MNPLVPGTLRRLLKRFVAILTAVPVTLLALRTALFRLRLGLKFCRDDVKKVLEVTGT
jgi:hypothetical protein